jgi:hypothetical protein
MGGKKMFCSNCGKQIQDDAKFCNHCGAQQSTINDTGATPKVSENQQKSADTPLRQSAGTPKKKTNIFVVLAVVLCAFLIGKFVIAPSMVSDSGKDNDTGNQGSQSQLSTENDDDSSVDSANPAYDAIFNDTYIVHFQTFFNLEMKNFAMKRDDGIICCSDYGYEDDVVKEWVETMYVPISECTDAQKLELENTMKSEFAAIDALNCCTVTYKMGTNYFTITCTYSDVDKAENYAELYNAQLLNANTFIF